MTKKIAQKKPYDLPLDRNSGGWLMSWIIGLMTYLSIIAILLFFGLSEVTNHWKSGLSGRMTIEISNSVAEDNENNIDDFIDAVNEQDNLTAHRLDDTSMLQLISPWLGDLTGLEDLPLPVLIDIQGTEDHALVQSMLDQYLPEATLDTHQKWIKQIIAISQTLKVIVLLLGLIVLVTAIAAVIGACRTFLALKSEEVSILHMIGATDSYIAKQFQRQSFRLALEGGVGGLVLILISLFSLTYAFDGMESSVLPNISLTLWHYLALLIVPYFMALLAMATSHMTVLWTLKRLI